MKQVSVFLATLITATVLWAREPVKSARTIEVIDVPTADVLDHYGYNVSFRFGKEGNLQTKTGFGVFPRLNLGFGLDAERVIGTENGRMNKPSINVKFRLFDGRNKLPALALGFDGQGYQYNKATEEYDQREKGLYLVSTSENLIKDFMLHIGGNIFDFDEGNSTRGFLGASYLYDNTFGLMAEWDSITEYKDRRINYGAKYYVTPVFAVEVAGRNVRITPTSSRRETERIIKLVYTGAF